MVRQAAAAVRSRHRVEKSTAVLRLIKLGAPAENAAADALKDLILRSWPDAEADPHCDIRIITGIYLSGQKVDDLDIVLLAVFQQPREVPLLNMDGSVVGSYLLASLCAVVEVKGHGDESTEIRSGALWVTYNGKQKNVTKQSRDQMHSLGEFLSAAGIGRPYVTRFIWLENVTGAELRQSSINGDLPHEIILKDSRWEDILTPIWRGWRGRHPEARGLGDNRYFISADINAFTPADFNRISLILTKEEMLLRPFSCDDFSKRESPSGYQATKFGMRSAGKPPPTLGLRNLFIGGLAVVLMGVTIAVYAPRLMLWNEQQKESTTSKGKLASYSGRYRCPHGMPNYSVTDLGDHLRISSGVDVGDLSPAAADEFKSNDANNGLKGTVRFTRARDGKIDGLVLLPLRGPKVTCSRVE
jgi:hypothetical protein